MLSKVDGNTKGQKSIYKTRRFSLTGTNNKKQLQNKKYTKSVSRDVHILLAIQYDISINYLVWIKCQTRKRRTKNSNYKKMVLYKTVKLYKIFKPNCTAEIQFSQKYLHKEINIMRKMFVVIHLNFVCRHNLQFSSCTVKSKR